MGSIFLSVSVLVVSLLKIAIEIREIFGFPAKVFSEKFLKTEFF